MGISRRLSAYVIPSLLLYLFYRTFIADTERASQTVLRVFPIQPADPLAFCQTPDIFKTKRNPNRPPLLLKDSHLVNGLAEVRQRGLESPQKRDKSTPPKERTLQAIFVMHVAEQTERRAYLDSYFDRIQLKIPVFYVTDYSKAVLSQDQINLWYHPDDMESRRRAYYVLRIDDKEVLSPNDVPPIENLTAGTVSVSLKMIVSWEAIVALNLDAALVVENDVIFNDDDSFKTLDYFLGQISKKDYSGPYVLWPGQGQWELPATGLERYSENLLLHTFHRSNFGDTYVLNAKAARILAEIIPPFTQPIDFELSYGQQHDKCRVFWTDSWISRQGSGQEYSSSLRNMSAGSVGKQGGEGESGKGGKR